MHPRRDRVTKKEESEQKKKKKKNWQESKEVEKGMEEEPLNRN